MCYACEMIYAYGMGLRHPVRVCMKPLMGNARSLARWGLAARSPALTHLQNQASVMYRAKKSDVFVKPAAANGFVAPLTTDGTENAAAHAKLRASARVSSDAGFPTACASTLPFER